MTGMGRDVARWVAELDANFESLMTNVALLPMGAPTYRVDVGILRNMASAWKLIRDEIVASGLKTNADTTDADEVVAGLESDHPLGQHETALRKLRAKFTSPSYRVADSIPVKLDEAHRILRTWDDVLVAWRPPQPIRFAPEPPNPDDLIGMRITLIVNPDGSISIAPKETDTDVD